MSDLIRMLSEASPDVARALRRLEAVQGEEIKQEMLDWAAHLRISRDLSGKTVSNYLQAVMALWEWLAVSSPDVPLTLGDVSAELVEKWIHHLFVVQKQAAKTRGLKLTAVRVFFAWREALGRGLNPAKGIKGPKRKRPLPKKYSEEHLIKFFGSCDLDADIGVRDYGILMLMYSTGARREETENLCLDQLSFNKTTGAAQFRGKGAKDRRVTFGKSCVDALHAWFAVRDNFLLDDPDAVFVAVGKGPRQGKRLQAKGIYGVVVRAAARAGVRISGRSGVHRLRVTFATDLYDTGVDIETISMLLGHEDINTTRGYIAISETRQKAKMPEHRLRKVTGRNKPTPLWAKDKLINVSE